MKKKELAKRYLLFVISLFFSALGIAFVKSGELGVTPISSVANILSLRFTAITIGNWLFITNCMFLTGQILLLRKKFKPIQLLQIPLSMIFGSFTDLGMWIASFVPMPSYPMQLAFVLFGTVLLAFGISLGVIANVIMNSGDAFIKALADTLHRNLGNVKVVFDICYVAISAILSMILFDGRILQTREGTVIGAFLTGFIIKFFMKHLSQPLERLLTR